MSEWLGRWISVRVDEWVDRQVGRQVDEWRSEQMDEWIDAWMMDDGQMIDGRMSGQIDVWVIGEKCGCAYEWMDRWYIGKWMSGVVG